MNSTSPTNKVRIQCVCGARLKASVLVCGSDVKCDHCGQIIHVPDLTDTGSLVDAVPANLDTSTWLRYRCSCGKTIKAPPTKAGKTGRCPLCHKPFTMPMSQSIEELARLNMTSGSDSPIAPVGVAGSTGTPPVTISEIRPDDADIMESEPGDMPAPLDEKRWLHVECSCGKVVKAPLSMAGKIGRCPRCKLRIIMPLIDVPSIGSLPTDFVVDQSTIQSGPASMQLSKPTTLVDAASASQAQVPTLKGVSKDELEARRQERLKHIVQLRPLFKRLLGVSITELPSHYPRASLAGSLALLAIAVCYGYTAFNGPDSAVLAMRPSAATYFYDLSTGKTYQGWCDVAPPAEPPSSAHLKDGSPAGVRAYVIGCGGCSNPATQRVAFIEKFDPETQHAWQKKILDTPGLHISDLDLTTEPANKIGRLISLPSPVSWVSAASPDASAILAEKSKPCPDGKASELCSPQVVSGAGVEK